MKLLGISGSLRRASYNTALMREAMRLFGPAEQTEADLNLPLFNEDLEGQWQPAPVSRLVDQVRAADAIVIACPEYNKAPPGVLKNALDWLSRAKPWPTEGKPVALMSATAGRAGGERTQYALRLMLVPFQMRIVPGPEVLIGQAAKQFGTDGRLTDETALALLRGQMERLRAMV